jgi:hypothetical protein
MDAGKRVQLKIHILYATHFIVPAWQQLTQSTIHNCFVKCGHVKKNEEGSDMTEVDGSGEDDGSCKMKTRFGWGQTLLASTLMPMHLWTRS